MRATPTSGASSHPLHSIWTNMKARCNNPNRHNYSYYGGRGISYDLKWEVFSGFIEDMEQGWTKGLTLERKDNDKNYSKENCLWTTLKAQCNNRRSNIILNYKGKDYTLMQLCELMDAPYDIVRARIKSGGWSTEQAIDTPFRGYANSGPKRNLW